MRTWLTALSLLLLTTPAYADGWPALNKAPAVTATGANDAALIVSVEDYAFLPDVTHANTNAGEWERFLSDGLGVPTVLVLSNEQAVREQILLSAERAASAVGEGGTLWFIFIGHGAPTEAGQGVLIGADGQQNVISIEARGVSPEELAERFGAGNQERTIMLVDACFSGLDRAGGQLAEGTMPVVAVEEPKQVDNIVMLTAARADEVAGNLPENGRPAFSYLMLGALRGWADDGDGTVTADEAVRFARREMMAIPGRRQTPQLHGSGRYVLAEGVAEERPSATVKADGGATGGIDRDSDGIGDWPIFFSLHGGFGNRSTPPEGDPPDFGPFGLALFGLKINALTGGAREWRVGVRANVFGPTAPGAPREGAFLTNFTTGSLSQVDDNDRVELRNPLTVFTALQFGHAWRTERPGSDDTVLELDVFGGLGQQTVCRGWELDTANNVAYCTGMPDGEGRSDSRIAAGGGIGFQAQWSLLEVSVQTAYLSNIGLVALAGAGISLDP